MNGHRSIKRRRSAVVLGTAVAAAACGTLAVIAARRRASPSSSFPVEIEPPAPRSSVRGAGRDDDGRGDRRAEETRRTRKATGVVRPQTVQPVQPQPRIQQAQPHQCHELSQKKCKQALGCDYNDLANACMPSLPGTPDLSGVCQMMNPKQCRKDPNCALWGPDLDVCVDAVHVVPIDGGGGGDDEPTDEPDDNDLVPLVGIGDNDGDDPCPGKPANKCKKAKECRWYRKKQECRRKPNADDKGDGGGAAGAAMIEPQARSDSEDYFNYLQDVAAAGEAAELASAGVASAPVVGCPTKGHCRSPEGHCGHRVQCVVDPCDDDPCEEGETCAANYCGGCHFACSPSPGGGVKAEGKPRGAVATEEESGPTFDDPPPEEPDGPAKCAVGPDAARLGLDASCAELEFCRLYVRTCEPLDEGTTYRGECARSCPTVYVPACGCDGKTYDNHCFVIGAGLSVAHIGECDRPPVEESDLEEAEAAFPDADAEHAYGAEAKAEEEPQGSVVTEEDPEPTLVEPPPDSPAKCAVGPNAASLGLDTCAEDEFCWLYVRTCDPIDGGTTYRGECARICPTAYVPVCGCDGKTYDNPCFAHGAGISVARAGDCDHPPPAEKTGPKEVKAVYPDADAEHADGVEAEAEPQSVDATEEEPEPAFGDPPPDSPSKKCAVGPDAASLGLDTCAEDEFCRLDDWTCEPLDEGTTYRGECARRPEDCPMPHVPVCGCNGRPYHNPCYAHRAGVSIALYDKCGRPPPVEKTGAKEDGSEAGADERRPERYWPVPAERGSRNGFHDCVRSSDYPDNYAEPHDPPMLFDTRAECCAAYPCARPERYWPVPAKRGTTFGTHDCVRSADYPDGYARFHDHEGQMPGRPYLFDTHEECCAAYPCARPEKYWPAPASRGTAHGIHDCVRSSDYPDSYFGDHEGPLLFDTYEECCDVYSCAADAKEAGAKPQEAVEVVTVVASAADGSVPMVDSLPAPTGQTGQHQMEQQATEMAEAIRGPCSDDSHCKGGSICDPSSATCTCDYDSDAVDGRNGCPVGEVCRMPCATAGGGPRCFKSNYVRDCIEVFGAGHVCSDGNEDGVIDKYDGGMGCVEVAEHLGKLLNDGLASLPEDHPLNEMLKNLPLDHPLGELLNDIDPKTLSPDDSSVELLNGIDQDHPSEELPKDVDPVMLPSEDALPSDGTGLTSLSSDDPQSADGPVKQLVATVPNLAGTFPAVPESTEAGLALEALSGEDAAIHREPARDATLDHLLNEIVPEPLPMGDPELLSEGTSATTTPPFVPQSVDGPVKQFDATVPNNGGTFPAVPEVTEAALSFEDLPEEEAAARPEPAHDSVLDDLLDNINPVPLPMGVPALMSESTDTSESPFVPQSVDSPMTQLDATVPNVAGTFPVPVSTEVPPVLEAFSSEDQAAATIETIATLASVREEYWFPPIADETGHCIFGNDYPDLYIVDDRSRETFLFGSYVDCCAAFPEGCVTTTTPSTEALAEKPETHSAHSTHCEWHIDTHNHNTCTNSGDYPAMWEDMSTAVRQYYFFSTAEACCERTQFGEDCVVVDECSSGTAGGVVEFKPAPSGDCEWHIDVHEHKVCTNSGDYPEEWDADEHREYHLFATAEECCETRFLGLDCKVVDKCAMDSVEAKDEEDRNGPSSGCEWHLDIDRHMTCTNSKDYPPEWDVPEHREYFLFLTAEECCEKRYPGQAQCGKVDVCAGEFLRLEPYSHTTDLPWDFGDPPQWEIDDSVSLPAEHPYALSWERDWMGLDDLETRTFDRHSMTNIFAEGFGAKSDLTLRVRVPEGHVAAVQCVALIDIGMPFDNFYVLVNGRSRLRFHNPEGGWTKILTGFEEGESTLTFRVENLDFGLGFERTEVFGTGRVWLDQCQIISYTV